MHGLLTEFPSPHSENDRAKVSGHEEAVPRAPVHHAPAMGHALSRERKCNTEHWRTPSCDVIIPALQVSENPSY